MIPYRLLNGLSGAVEVQIKQIMLNLKIKNKLTIQKLYLMIES